MAKIDVLTYYNNSISQYKELVATLEDLQKACENKEIDKERVEAFIPLVENARANLDCLSYVVYLLNLPRIDFKQIKQSIKNKTLLEYFKKKKLDRDTTATKNSEVIKQIEDAIKEINK